MHVFVYQSQYETLHVVKEENVIPLYLLYAAVSNLSYSIMYFFPSRPPFTIINISTHPLKK